MTKRVVVTGIGAITPLGNSVDEFWDNIKLSKNGISQITKFDTENFKVKIAAEVKNFDPLKYMEKRDIKRYDLFSQYAIAATCEAMIDSNIDYNKIDPERMSVIVGSGIGGLTTTQEQILKSIEKGPSKVSPLFIPMAISNMAAGNVAIRFGAKGLCTSIVTACATGTNSIGDAFRYIKHGYSDIVISGSSEATINKIGISGFTSITALTQCNDIDRASIPFDVDRSGFVMGEGSGILILEELSHALKRDAKIYGEIVGYGVSCDAYHMTSPTPDGEGAQRAIKNALAEACISADQISYVNAHGTSTPANDPIETKSIKNTFGDHAYKVPISSTKSMIGHLLGAAGSVEAVICLKAMCDDFVPATINLKNPDPECDLNYVPNFGYKQKLDYVLSNSLGFGGHNAILCFKRWEC